MRHERKIMKAGPTHERNGRVFRNFKCEECGVIGGESARRSSNLRDRVCHGFDDDTGRPCDPLPVDPPPADTPVIVEGKS